MDDLLATPLQYLKGVGPRRAADLTAAGLVTVEDLGSSYGTFVNGRRIDAPAPLLPGDRLRVGQTELRFEAP